MPSPPRGPLQNMHWAIKEQKFFLDIIIITDDNWV
jgi:hypothetical protein